MVAEAEVAAHRLAELVDECHLLPPVVLANQPASTKKNSIRLHCVCGVLLEIMPMQMPGWAF